MAMFKSLCFATALLALAGCTGVVVNDMPGPRASYFDGDFEYATHLGAIVTQIVGNPFDIPAETFRDAVLRDMQGHARNGSARFVAEPSNQTMAAYKVVAAFDMPPWVDGSVLCKGAASLPPADPRCRICSPIYAAPSQPARSRRPPSRSIAHSIEQAQPFAVCNLR